MSLAFSSGTIFLLLSRSLDTAQADAFHLATGAPHALLLTPSRTVLFLACGHLLLRLGTHRVQKQHRLESSAELAHLRGLEARAPHHRSRIAVPVAMAHAAGREGHERILYPRGNASLRAHMFEQQERPSRLEHPPDLAQAALRILHRTEDERGHSSIEMRVGEREGLDRRAGERDGNGCCRKSAPGRDQHGLVWLDRLHALHAGRILFCNDTATT